MLPNKFHNKLPNLCPSVKGLGHKFGNLLPSPFTLATCVATSPHAWRAPAASSIFSTYNDVTEGFTVLWNPTATAYSPGHGQWSRRLDETLMTSLGIPLSDWLNENVLQLVASVNGSVEQRGEYKFSNKFSNWLLNLLSNMWLV